MKIILTAWILAVLPLQVFALDPSCKGCGAGKLMLQCDYYVAKQGDMSRQHLCEEYAKIVDIDGASAKAAWYYLLAGKPQKAFDAAIKALKQGQTFAAGYAAQAMTIMDNPEKAKQYLSQFTNGVEERDYFEKEVSTLRKIYPSIDFSILSN
ncbi:hypothetical protein [Hydrogenimonas sp.]|uniref:hypothetical protein n=1 Tax=Hydrogenimonas sp. TaxID=2231112 RepID=UPI00262DBA54|nr:hypothetical protein [Hydrogenimonas sp.]